MSLRNEFEIIAARESAGRRRRKARPLNWEDTQSGGLHPVQPDMFSSPVTSHPDRKIGETAARAGQQLVAPNDVLGSRKLVRLPYTED